MNCWCYCQQWEDATNCGFIFSRGHVQEISHEWQTDFSVVKFTEWQVIWVMVRETGHKECGDKKWCIRGFSVRGWNSAQTVKGGENARLITGVWEWRNRKLSGSSDVPPGERNWWIMDAAWNRRYSAALRASMVVIELKRTINMWLYGLDCPIRNKVLCFRF